MNTWHLVDIQGSVVEGGTAGRAKHRAFVTVYLLTGPMLLGIPARQEEKRQRSMNQGVKLHLRMYFNYLK